MARKLKTYTTSAGFFDLAVAAPSMKAALETWGSRNDLFKQGFARQTDDPAIVAATMATPGVVLRRPVGSDGAFSEQAELPKHLPVGKVRRAPAKRNATRREPPSRPVDDKGARRAALAFEKEQKRRERARRRDEASRAKERRRRERAIAAAEAALADAARTHEARVADLDKERAALDRKAQAEEARWRRKKDGLEEALHRARSASHLRAV